MTRPVYRQRHHCDTRLLHLARVPDLHHRVLRPCLSWRLQILRSFLSLAWRRPLPTTCRTYPAAPGSSRCQACIAISSSLLRTFVVFASATSKIFAGRATASCPPRLGHLHSIANQPASKLMGTTRNTIRKETREMEANNEPTKTHSHSHFHTLTLTLLLSYSLTLFLTFSFFLSFFSFFLFLSFFLDVRQSVREKSEFLTPTPATVAPLKRLCTTARQTRSAHRRKLRESSPWPPFPHPGEPSSTRRWGSARRRRERPINMATRAAERRCCPRLGVAEQVEQDTHDGHGHWTPHLRLA